MKLAVVNGPNLNLIGLREPNIYGTMSYPELVKRLQIHGANCNVEVVVYQSNHEGALIDYLQSLMGKVDGIIINAGAYTHTSIALLDCLLAMQIPTVEVHLSDLSQREAFRQVSYLRAACQATFQGHHIQSYYQAIDYFVQRSKQR